MQERIKFENELDEMERKGELVKFIARGIASTEQELSQVNRHLMQLNGTVAENQKKIAENTLAHLTCPIHIVRRRWFWCLVGIAVLIIGGANAYDGIVQIIQHFSG
jgi:hypothetical protein